MLCFALIINQMILFEGRKKNRKDSANGYDERSEFVSNNIENSNIIKIHSIDSFFLAYIQEQIWKLYQIVMSSGRNIIEIQWYCCCFSSNKVLIIKNLPKNQWES